MAAFKEEVEAKKRFAETQAGVAEIENRLQQMSGSKAANAQKVVARMNAGSNDSLIGMCLTAWIRFSADYKKNQEMELAVQASEKKIAEFMKKQNDSAKGVLGRMTAASETGLLHSAFTAWAEFFFEDKKSHTVPR